MLRYKLSVGGLEAQTVERIGIGLEANLDAGKFLRELEALLRVQGYAYASALSIFPKGEKYVGSHAFWAYEVGYPTDAREDGKMALSAQAVCGAAEEIETGVLEAVKIRGRLALLAPEPDDIPY